MKTSVHNSLHARDAARMADALESIATSLSLLVLGFAERLDPDGPLPPVFARRDYAAGTNLDGLSG